MQSFSRTKSYIIAVIAALVIITGGLYFKNRHNGSTQIIAITQIASHPSLNLIRQGVIDELTDSKALNGKYKVVFENAQGNIATAAQISQKFAGLRPKVIVAITTPSAQTMKNAIKNTGIKMVFSAVTDPIGANLVADFIDHDDQITGTVDLPPIQSQLQTILKYRPQAKRIGVVFNPGEINSVKQVDKLKEYAAAAGVEILLAPATKTVDVGTATTRLVGAVDAFYVPNDNTVVSAIESLIKVAKQHGKLVMVSDPESLAKGADIALANDQYQVGRETGKLVYQILNGENVGQIPVKMVEAARLTLNRK